MISSDILRNVTESCAEEVYAATNARSVSVRNLIDNLKMNCFENEIPLTTYSVLKILFYDWKIAKKSFPIIILLSNAQIP